MEGLFTFIIIVIWVIIGLLNVLKKRAEKMEGSKPGMQPRPASPRREVRPQPRRPASPRPFTPKRETTPPVFAPEQPTVPRPRQRQTPSRPALRRMTAESSQVYGAPRPAVFQAEEAFEERVVAQPPPREVHREPSRAPRLERPRRAPKPLVPAVRHREARDRFRISDNPIINGIIFSELFGPPIAKRPFHRRRMF